MSDTVQLDLPLLLPEIPDAKDTCVDRLISSLQPRDGIDRVHVAPAQNGEPDRLCIHYDPEVVSLSRIRQTAHSLGTEITDQYGHLSWSVRGISHPRRARTIAKRLRQINGVVEATASAAEKIRVEYDRSTTHEREIRDVLRSMGVRLRKTVIEAQALDEPSAEGVDVEDDAPQDRGGIFGERTELTVAMLAGVCVAAGFGLSFFENVSAWLPWALYVSGYILGGYHTVRGVLETLRVGEFEVDFLMLVAAGGAAVLGKWLEGAFLLVLFSLGHSLEHYAMGRAQQAIESLADLSPETALVRRNGTEAEIPVGELEVGDTVIVKPNEHIPADGFVVKGESAVNQAPVTGESVPVDKAPVATPDAVDHPDELEATHQVFAGTINGSGALEVQVTRRADETTMSRMVEMITDAKTEKSPIERFTDRFERVFVPAVLGLVGVLLFAWVPLDETMAESFYRAMAVLVAASPCALAIATPSAVLSGVARAGQNGVLVKGGGPLERLGRLKAVAFDKTGTLTDGKPRVTDVHPYDGHSNEELLRTALAVESLSDHPLAEAVVRYAEEQLDDRPREDAYDLESIAGLGVRASVEGQPVHVGKDTMFETDDGPPLPDDLRQTVSTLESDGRTTMIVRRGNQYLGVLGLADTPREGARDIIAHLRELGVHRTVMISGDNQRVVDSVGTQLGIDHAHGDLLPGDKVDMVQTLRREEDVAMVGDGVNDAPAMANATVGIAMGAAGSDTALETADVALMADDLTPLPFAFGLSQQTRRIVQQNLWIALGMVVILVPATILGLDIGPAVVLHEGSTLLVVANALRLLRYESKPRDE